VILHELNDETNLHILLTCKIELNLKFTF